MTLNHQLFIGLVISYIYILITVQAIDNTDSILNKDLLNKVKDTFHIDPNHIVDPNVAHKKSELDFLKEDEANELSDMLKKKHDPIAHTDLHDVQMYDKLPTEITNEAMPRFSESRQQFNPFKTAKKIAGAIKKVKQKAHDVINFIHPHTHGRRRRRRRRGRRRGNKRKGSRRRRRRRRGKKGKKGKKKNYRVTSTLPNQIAQAFEDCAGCRLVWRQVEMDVSNARFRNDVEASFLHNCAQAEMTTIFFHPCQVMKKYLFYRMLDDYMSQQFTVDQMCTRVGFCQGLKKYGYQSTPTTSNGGSVPKPPIGCKGKHNCNIIHNTSCCKFCKKSQKPCGNGCIPKNYKCGKRRGCACWSGGRKPTRKCCKLCTIGKPCGNSCIARWKKCHKGKGCACSKYNW